MEVQKDDTQGNGNANTQNVTNCSPAAAVMSFIQNAAYMLLGEDEETVVTTGKKDKKNKTHKVVFSKRFIRVTSIFGVLILSLFIAGLIKILGIGPAPKLPGFTYVNVSRVSVLKASMAQRGPRIVYCTNVKMPPETFRIASLAVKSLPTWINRFALDCSAKLPSGRTAYQRFELDPTSTIMFVQAHGKKAVPLTEYIIKNPQQFFHRVVNTATYALKRVDDVEAFNKNVKEHKLVVVTDARRLNPYNPDHTVTISRVIDTNRLYDMTTWIVNDTVHELNFIDEEVSKGHGFTMHCIVPYRGKYILGTSTVPPFGKAMETFIRQCAKVVQPSRDFRIIEHMPQLEVKTAKTNTKQQEKHEEKHEHKKEEDEEEVLQL